MGAHSFFDKKNWNAWFHVTYFSTNTWKNYKFDWTHSHDRLEILYVYYGELTLYYYNGETWREMILYSNDYAVIDTNIQHMLKTGDCITQVYSLEIELLPETVSSMQYNLGHLVANDKNTSAFFIQDERVIRLSDAGHVSPLLLEITKYLKLQDETEKASLDLLLSALFVSIGADYSRQQLSLKSGIKYIRRSLDYISSNIYHDINCKEIARQAGISLNYLNLLFSQSFHMTLNNYIHFQRIKQAASLIERTNLPLSEIYSRVGYKSNQNFNTQFIKHMGCSPSAYRKNLKEMHLEKNFGANKNLVFELPQKNENTPRV